MTRLSSPPTVVIVGGGTAGWMAAAALARFFGTGDRRIVLVEAEHLPPIGVGESTIPSILNFIRMLDLDEDEVIRGTDATFKLGIGFTGWGRPESSYFHPFSVYGHDVNGVPFHHLFLRDGDLRDIGGIGDYSIGEIAAARGRFARRGEAPEAPSLRQLTYALHLDSALFGRMLKDYAEDRGVERLAARVAGAEQSESGDVVALRLEGGDVLRGDLFVDCSGFRAILIGEAMGEPFVDWSTWLPCDRAIALGSASGSDLPLHTQADAHEAGWRWRIPLQRRFGNGIVYAAQAMSDDRAEAALRASLAGAPAGEANRIRFRPGHRAANWRGNVVALGLSAGFVEPLEATSIHLIHEGIIHLIRHFPAGGINPVERKSFNRRMKALYEATRDFIILHYKLNERNDSDFWRHCAAMAVPTSLADRIETFRRNGRVLHDAHEIFRLQSWVAVMLGQGVKPEARDPIVDSVAPALSSRVLATIRDVYHRDVARLETHQAALRRVVGPPSTSRR